MYSPFTGNLLHEIVLSLKYLRGAIRYELHFIPVPCSCFREQRLMGFTPCPAFRVVR